MSVTERKLREDGCPEIAGYRDLEKVLNLKRKTIYDYSCGRFLNFPQPFCRGKFRRIEIAQWIDESPRNIIYARFATEVR